MCGIGAILSVEQANKLADLAQMMELVSHRGPDGYGFLVQSSSEPFKRLVSEQNDLPVLKKSQIEGEILLGHTRLSILDLGLRSAQPICSQDETCALVFNGEIYNFVEIREELQELGFRFETSGDSEVLLNALRCWGEAALTRLRGMFSFVFVDFKAKKALAVRDRFGIKPLYRYKSSHETIAFVSEIKQLIGLANWNATVNQSTARTFLANGLTDYSEETLFEGVTQIMPGWGIRISLTDLSEEKFQWYKLSKEQKKSIQSYQKIFEDRLKESIDLHLRSDVEIASCLSGGLDSTALVALVVENQHKNSGFSGLQTFTAGSNNQDIDESGTARLVADFLGIRNTTYTPHSADFKSVMKLLTWHQDQPFASTSIISQFMVHKMIHEQNIKVALDGQGADELLGGYDDYITAFITDLILRGRLFKAYKNFDLFRKMKRTSFSSLTLFLSLRIFPNMFIQRIMQYRSRTSRKFLAGVYKGHQHLILENPLPNFFLKRSSVEELRKHQFMVGLPMLLRFEDRNSMSSSVEARVPFLDHELVNEALQIPVSELFAYGNTKSPLRRLVAKCLPSSVVNQTRKIGFAAEEWSWMVEESDHVMNQINMQFDFLSSVSSVDFVNQCLYSLAHDNENKFLWRLYSLAVWSRVFNINL